MATTEAHIPPLLGVTPLGPTPLQKEHQLQFQMMEAAFYHLPQPIDTEKLQTYFHRYPVQTPAHYPQVSQVDLAVNVVISELFISSSISTFQSLTASHSHRRHSCPYMTPLSSISDSRRRRSSLYSTTWRDPRLSILRPRRLKSRAGASIPST